MAWTNVVTRATNYFVTATNWNEFVNNFKAIGDPRTAYSPTWTSSSTPPAVGNGTITGSYLSIGKLVIGTITLTLGSTSTVGAGSYRFSLPVTALTSGIAVGSGVLQDSSPNTHYGVSAELQSTTTLQLVQGGSGGGLVTATSPITPATSDVFTVQFVYEAA